MLSRAQLAKMAEALKGIPIWGTLPGSLSHGLGVRYGDVLIAVNGVRTSNIDEYLDARNLREDGADVVIFRDGEELHLSFAFADLAKTPARLEQVALEVVEARLVPTERPPPPPEEPEN